MCPRSGQIRVSCGRGLMLLLPLLTAPVERSHPPKLYTPPQHGGRLP